MKKEKCARGEYLQFCVAGLYFSFALWISINLGAFPVRCWNIVLQHLVVLNNLVSPTDATNCFHASLCCDLYLP